MGTGLISKIIGGVALVLILLILLVISLLPSLASTSYGNTVLLKWVNNRIPGKVSVEHFSISWFGNQQIKKFKLYDPQGKEVLTIDSLSSNFPLLYAIFGRYHFGQTVLEKPYFIYRVDLNCCSNLEKALYCETKRSKKKKQPPKFSGKISINDGTLLVEAPNIQPITVSGINLLLNGKSSLFEVSGKTEQGGSGSFLLKGNFGPNFDFHADVKNFPVTLLDQLKCKPLYSAAIGPKINVVADVERKAERLNISLNVDSLNVKGNIFGQTKDNSFILDPASQLQFALTPTLFDLLVPTESWHLANKPLLLIKFDELIYPLDQGRLDFFKIPIKGNVRMERAEISNDKLGNFSLNDWKATILSGEILQFCYEGQIQSIKGSTLLNGSLGIDGEGSLKFDGRTQGFPVELLDLFLENGRRLSLILGSHLDLNFDGTYHKGHLATNYAVTSKETHFTGTLAGQDPSHLKLKLKGSHQFPKRFCKLLGDKADIEVHSDLCYENDSLTFPVLQARILNPHITAEVTGNLGVCGMPFRSEDIHLVCNGVLKDLYFPGQQEGFKEGTFFAEINGNQNLILAKADLGSLLNFGPEIHGSARIENFLTNGDVDFNSSEICVSGIASRLPSNYLNLFFESDVELVSLVGPKLTLEFKGAYTPKKEDVLMTLDLMVQGTGVDGNLSVSLDRNLHVMQNKPSFLHWEMTPERYTALTQLFGVGDKSRYNLVQKAILELNVRDFTCPAPPRESLSQFLCQSGFVGDILICGVKFSDPSRKDFLSLPSISGSIHGEDFSKCVYLNLIGNIESGSIPEGQKSDFLFNGEMCEFWTPTGKFNRDRLQLKGDLRFDYLPVKEILGVLPFDEEIRIKTRALLGPLVNGRLSGEIRELSGPVTIDIKSTNFKAVLPMELQKGTLLLRETVETELTLTREVSDVFLRDINPLFITGAWSDHPVKLYIDAQGFMVPLHPFNLAEVRVETMVIDLNRIAVRNGGDIQALMNFLKAKEVSPDNVMEAWFTPIFVNLRGGVARYRRFDVLLAGNVHLAFWGQIDLINDRVDMTLGISEKTLTERFNISGGGRTNMFQLKMGGTTSHVSVDWTGATTRIGILIAKSAGGGLGALVGGLIEQFVSTMEQEPTPPPTTSPLPWERGRL